MSALTLHEWLGRTTEMLADAGIDSPRADAERLAAHGLGCDWGELWGRLRDPVDGLDALAASRAAGTPLAYVLGSAVFYGREFAVGPGVLVPRPETETLVDAVLDLASGLSRRIGGGFGGAQPPREDRPAQEALSTQVFEAGTGSGCVAITLAAELATAQVYATDISQRALAYARDNAQRHAVQVHFAHGDLFEALPHDLRGSLSVVCSNPPYVADGAQLPADVRAEPAEALFAGADGDAVLGRIVAEAPGWLRRGGALALEVGTPEQAGRVVALLGDWTERGVRADHTGRPRVVWAIR